MGSLQRLFQVLNQVVGIFQTDAQPHQARVDARSPQLRIAQLPVRMRSGMQDAAVAVGHVGLDRDQPQGVHKAVVKVPASLETKAEHAAGAIGKIFPGPFVILVSLLWYLHSILNNIPYAFVE